MWRKPASANPVDANSRSADEPARDGIGARPPAVGAPAGPRRPLHRMLIYRHSVVVRITHWVNVVCLAVLLMSGLQIFNAHPALYLGNLSDFSHPLLSMSAVQAEGGPERGVTTVFGHSFNTTGLLGLSQDAAGHSAGARVSGLGHPARSAIAGGRAAFGTSSSRGCLS